jgi:predicted TIM-barrel fold metal-dependent hydrolase
MPLYDGPVIDAHHHFWQPELGHQPWLRPGVDIGFRYGPYESLKRPYLPQDIRADADEAGIRLVGTVTMETEWELDDPIGEMEYTAAIAEREGLPDAAVAHAVLQDPGVDSVLEALAEIPLVRGVRHKPGGSASPRDATAHPTLLSDPRWRRGLGLLAAHGLSFDLQVPWWHLPEAVDVLEETPDLSVIVDHAGLPADRSADALAAWQGAMGLLARFPQVTVKVSGIGQRDRPWTADANAPVVRRLLDIFGPDRLMFASNFPVDGLTATYAQIWNGFREIVADCSQAEQTAMFAGTARRVYRLPEELLAG